jgi:predicted ATPase
VIATHSPIVLAYPDATILACTDDGLHETAYHDAEPVRLTRGFLEAPYAFLRALLQD